MAPKHKTLVLDGRSLTLQDLAPLFEEGPLAEVRLAIAPAAKQRVRAAREVVERAIAGGAPVYGVTTGFGKLKNQFIPEGDLAELQENLILSHCCGIGPNMPIPEVRCAQVLRLNGLLRGHSGITLELAEALLELFHAQFVPLVPQKGSVGASGDLAPLSHMAAAYLGHGEVCLRGKGMSARAALKRIGRKPLVLRAKEGLALINGTEIIKSIAVGALLRAENASKAADALAALSIEALLGSARPFDARFAELKGQPAHARAAANVRRCLAGSQVLASHADCDRVQDPYSLRCVPQIHGAFKAAFAHVREIVCNELNAVTDNPIVFPESGEVVSAGQFHGQPLSVVLDYLGLALATLANVSERRIEQLVNPDLSHLPAFLTPKPGLNSGFMIAQVAAAALASENKVLAHPASVDTIPTSANQEDHVSMGVTAARKAVEIVGNVEHVLALEWLAAAQAREFHSELRAGKGAAAAHALLREFVPALKRDRYLAGDIRTACELLRSGELVRAVERAAGKLES
ncbi:MAG: histidine ammonia-lyase [Planctomycetes bacterium]|nr:histidine ammonia-lyase [Planctomycetota bacterium]